MNCTFKYILMLAIGSAAIMFGLSHVNGQNSTQLRNPNSFAATVAEDFGEAPNLNWYYQFEGFRPILGMDSDNEGNLYTLGTLSQTTDLFGRTFRKGTFLCKQNGSGEVVWIKPYPEIQMDRLAMGDMVHIDTIQKTVLFCGVLRDTLIIPNHAKHYPNGVECLVVVKYDLDGRYILSFQIDLNTFQLEGFTTDPIGNIIVTGIFQGTAKIGNQVLISAGGRDALVAKFNEEGEPQWANRVGGETNRICWPGGGRRQWQRLSCRRIYFRERFSGAITNQNGRREWQYTLCKVQP